jgi:hypothetical protein
VRCRQARAGRTSGLAHRRAEGGGSRSTGWSSGLAAAEGSQSSARAVAALGAAGARLVRCWREGWPEPGSRGTGGWGGRSSACAAPAGQARRPVWARGVNERGACGAARRRAAGARAHSAATEMRRAARRDEVFGQGGAECAPRREKEEAVGWAHG